MGPTIVYRTSVSRLLAWSVVVIAVLALVYFATVGGPLELLRSGSVAAAVAAAAWALFEAPHVTVSDGGVSVRNVLRTVHVPWPDFRGVETAWSLRLRTTEGDVESWAIPAPSGLAARGAASPAVRRRASPNASVRVVRGVNAAVVALEIGQRHHALTAQGWLRPGQPQVGLTRSWNRGTLALLGGAAALVALGTVLG